MRVKISSSPKPLSTKGSAPNTKAFDDIVSVAETATFLILTPASPYVPILSERTIGIDVYWSGLSGIVISNLELTAL